MMKKKLRMIGLVFGGVLLCACQSQPSDSKATTDMTDKTAANSTAASNKADPKVVEDVKAIGFSQNVRLKPNLKAILAH